MPMIISKKTIFLTLISIWLLSTFVYIPLDLWNHFKNEQLARAYNLGRADTVNAAIEQAENDRCESFSISGNGKQAQVINIKCLKQAEEAR